MGKLLRSSLVGLSFLMPSPFLYFLLAISCTAKAVGISQLPTRAGDAEKKHQIWSPLGVGFISCSSVSCMTLKDSLNSLSRVAGWPWEFGVIPSELENKFLSPTRAAVSAVAFPKARTHVWWHNTEHVLSWFPFISNSKQRKPTPSSITLAHYLFSLSMDSGFGWARNWIQHNTQWESSLLCRTSYVVLLNHCTGISFDVRTTCCCCCCYRVSPSLALPPIRSQ